LQKNKTEEVSVSLELN